MNFSSHVDTVITVAVKLVNALTPGEAHGRELSAARRPGTARRRDRRAAVRRSPAPGRSRGEAAELATSPAQLRRYSTRSAGRLDGAARLVNDLLAEHRRAASAGPARRRAVAPAFSRPDRLAAQGWAAGCATGLAVVLGTELYGRLGVCTAPRCDRVYVDMSRNGTRRFCSTSCQNRVKAAAFRARQG